MTHHAALHHFHIRKGKRIKVTSLIHTYDRFMYIVAIVVPLATIPQVIEIYAKQTAENISLATWTGYLLGAIFWLTYSLIHKDKILILNSSLWVILELAVIMGIFIYN